MVITGTSAYLGNTTVNAGVLRVNGNLGSSPTVTATTAGTLQGNGSVASATISSGGAVSPGNNAVGTLTVTNNAALNGGGSYVWEISDGNGVAGTGYDSINVGATLTVGASSASPFTIKVTGTPANFPGTGSWTIATAAAISGFDARSFSVDTSGLSATLDPNKSFRVTQSGNNLVLTYADPAITADPANVVVSTGQNAIFNVTAVGASVTYQWQKGGVNISNGGNISGATTTSLTVSSVTAGDVASYDVVVTDSTIPASVTIAAATLDIVDAPIVTSQPVSQTVGSGTNAIFTISWSGSDPAKTYTTFKWQTNGVNISDGAKYAGTTTSNLTVLHATSTDAAGVLYAVALTNSVGSTSSSSATLAIDTVPTISVQPHDIFIAFGDTTNTTVTAAGGDLRYQWWFTNATSTNAVVDGPNYVGAQTATLTLTNALDTQSGGYSVVITNYAGAITSSVGVVNVAVDPVIVTSPTNRSVVTGSQVVFSVTATGKPNLIYQWSKDASPLTDSLGHIAGATTSSLTLSGVTAGADNGSYVVRVSNDFDAAFQDTTPASLTVFDSPQILSGATGGGTFSSGDTVQLSATASGTALTYQWKKGNANVSNGTVGSTTITGATTQNLTIAGVTVANMGSYTMVAANPVGSATSAVAVVTVNQAPTITTQPANAIANGIGGTASFTVAATGNPLNYQWYANGSAVPGATDAVYALSNVQPSNIGNYFVVVSNNFGTATSTLATLTIGAFLYDSFENDTSANWNKFANQADTRATWAFNYATPGVPQNPNSATTKALKLEANLSSGVVPNAITLIPKTLNVTGDYEMNFDIWMNFVGPAPGGGTGSTEHFTAGVSCSGPQQTSQVVQEV